MNASLDPVPQRPAADSPVVVRESDHGAVACPLAWVGWWRPRLGWTRYHWPCPRHPERTLCGSVAGPLRVLDDDDDRVWYSGLACAWCKVLRDLAGYCWIRPLVEAAP